MSLTTGTSAEEPDPDPEPDPQETKPSAAAATAIILTNFIMFNCFIKLSAKGRIHLRLDVE